MNTMDNDTKVQLCVERIQKIQKELRSIDRRKQDLNYELDVLRKNMSDLCKHDELVHYVFSEFDGNYSRFHCLKCKELFTISEIDLNNVVCKKFN
jgi:hypothetical protein